MCTSRAQALEKTLHEAALRFDTLGTPPSGATSSALEAATFAPEPTPSARPQNQPAPVTSGDNEDDIEVNGDVGEAVGGCGLCALGRVREGRGRRWREGGMK